MFSWIFYRVAREKKILVHRLDSSYSAQHFNVPRGNFREARAGTGPVAREGPFRRAGGPRGRSGGALGLQYETKLKLNSALETQLTNLANFLFSF